ncbi:hypothetical protein HDA40_001925 [Hamadaea flava]|uniref:Uncharacterized protein n=1 Tax=Hamadaea flava TaxID=1742688 RepID=A0ABV8LDV2_9ACTN|nr:hypothetical protein [Hamadaea flava]MCP2323418.1 hypothetical protein [Hamadaea flava]
MYSGLSAVATADWRRFAAEAEDRIWVSTDDPHIVDVLGGMMSLLRERASAKVDVRLLLAVEHQMPTPRRVAIRRPEGPFTGPRVVIFGGVMLVLYDQADSAASPVLRLQRIRGGGMFAAFTDAFRLAWADAVPVRTPRKTARTRTAATEVVTARVR